MFKSKKSNLLINAVIVLLALLLLFIVIEIFSIDSTNLEINPDTVLVHFIDVGQANATLMIGPDFTVLVDAGHFRRDDVVPYLRSIGVKELDLLVGSHPHADHIGQFDKVLDAFPVTEVWMSGDVHTTRTFERAIDAISRSEASYYEPRAGESFEIGSLILEVLNPEQLTGDFHEGCIAIRAVYKDFSVLLTGDIERPIEQKLVNEGTYLKSTILELGHHGSRTSSSQEFIDAVTPDIAIYSAGRDNEYGHPHKQVIDRLYENAIPVYGTDIYGTIVVQTNGFTYELFFEKD
ncbi:ComEC/Rec2 family competence protein [Desulfuribacillus alkaliarsenatis]|uniref:Metallo-beta-lactamase domain-containing protein n=1 Tax=Desulfuribacillus alkaliarsenatis TaxID=766136 RepID=A0A1E5G032_9FIRM|nr:ComEC/Rec2 family competence protein [Desulfuribacillus alkaliarsenatis]OEF96191.1 hypothetical protein BHF68_08465 [Desulfuribacillus alkaliarsenatis]